MNFYDITKPERIKLVNKITNEILSDIIDGKNNHILKYFSDEDTYIRKNAYLSIGKIYKSNKELRNNILSQLEILFDIDNPKVRQTVINSAGEIGISDFDVIENLLEKGLSDEHHSVRNAVIGSMKKIGEKNPKPILKFAKKYLHHPNKEIRREICHGIELFGRTNPQYILPLLKELQNDETARVRNTVIHVLGQISYKKGCLETIIADLKWWENNELVGLAIAEIIDVHERYKNFSALTQKEAIEYINENFIQ